MAFTQNWFDVTGRPLWEAHIKPRFAGKDDLRFLEIGSHEGGSAKWICDNILTGERCALDCVDPFTGSMEHTLDPDLEARFQSNLAAEIEQKKVRVFKRTSFYHFISIYAMLHPIGWPETFDLVYIDGSHVAKDVLMDAMLAWPLLKVGGLLVFDDYAWRVFREPELAPKLAVDCFHSLYKSEMKVLHVSSQAIVEKTPSTQTMTLNRENASRHL